MEHYKILGVDKNTSMEEITKAYEDRVNKFKEEIEDEKRVKSFINVFDEAYKKIKEEREKNRNEQTVIIDNQVKDLNNNFHKDDSNGYESFNQYEQESTAGREKKRSSSKSTSIGKQKRAKKKSTGYRENIKSEKQSKNDNSRKAGSNKKNSAPSLTQLPLKILFMPVVAILSIIIFLCKILNIISWIASKIIIIAAISISAIHGYQIYIGHVIQYKIFVLCAVGFVVSLFLPSILKMLVSTLSKVNSTLKKFVF
ncbi:molecular chaperone DnaJ [Clostridium sp. UBA7503]|uniref:molecular chaperone DnaJ n=1 Tax=Clostridium sp. UBA7503 TaxID=1946377 RepID=UPI003216B763